MTKEEIQAELAARKALAIRQRHYSLCSAYVRMQEALKKHGVNAAFQALHSNTRFNSKMFTIDAHNVVRVNKFQHVINGDIVNDRYIVCKVDGKALRVQNLLTKEKRWMSTEQIRSMR